MRFKRIYLTSGISGSGKSTFVNKFMVDTPRVVLSSDAIRKELFGEVPYEPYHNRKVFPELFNRIRNALASEDVGVIIIDTTALRFHERNNFYKIFSKCDVPHEVSILSFRPWTARSLLYNYYRKDKVPDRVILDQSERYQPPYQWEYPGLTIIPVDIPYNPQLVG